MQAKQLFSKHFQVFKTWQQQQQQQQQQRRRRQQQKQQHKTHVTVSMAEAPHSNRSAQMATSFMLFFVGKFLRCSYWKSMFERYFLLGDNCRYILVAIDAHNTSERNCTSVFGRKSKENLLRLLLCSYFGGVKRLLLLHPLHLFRCCRS